MSGGAVGGLQDRQRPPPRAPARAAPRACAAALGLASAACGTTGSLPFDSPRLWTFPDTQRSWTGGDAVIPRVYGGVALDLELLRHPSESFALVDLPFSFVADTLLLPYTIQAQLRHGSLELRAPGAAPAPAPASSSRGD